MENRLMLIDGNSLTYRAFFATAMSPAGIMKNPNGTPINAIMTLTRILVRVIDTYKPTHILVAFDAGKKTLRHDKLESYKGGRAKTPEELIVQFPLVKVMLDKMGIKHFEMNGIEADDIIGTAATRFSHEGEVLVLSSDKDLYQLVDKNISIIVPQNGAKPDLIIRATEFYDQFGYHPKQVPDIKGIMGDPSDNLPGVAGIGSKGAIKLIQEYETLEMIYENICNISGATKEKLINSKDVALLCKEIATLIRNVDVPFDFSDLKYHEKITDELIGFYEELYIKSLVTLFQNRRKQLNKNNDNFDQKFML